MPEVNGIYRLAVIGTCNAQQHIHTMHMRSTVDAVAETEPAYQQALIDAWQAGARTTYRAMFADDDNPCEQYSVRKVCGTEPLPAGVDEGEAAGSIAGTIGRVAGALGDRLPPWISSVVTLRTGLAGRRYRGRHFIGGLSEGHITGDLLLSGGVGHRTAYYTALLGLFGPSGTNANYRMFVFSRLLASVVGSSCEDNGADVTSVQVRTYLATQKSRRAGSGI